jgi:radial spoke head protein 4A
MTYWVSHSSFDKWVVLPDISPSDMGASRKIKILFTGDLEKPIYADPYFFKAKKTEKHYLRAQIARIVHSTSLCPKGLFRLVEDSTKDIEENAPEEGDLVLPSTKAMANPSMWVHHTVGIL